MSDQGLVLVETVISAPRDAVWAALRDPAKIRRWHGWENEDLDAEIDFVYGEHADEHAAEGILDIPGVGTTFTLEDRGPETLLRVSKAAAAPADGGYDDIDDGWISFVYQLRFGLERHNLAERRTVQFDGSAEADAGPLTAATLGLTGAHAAPVGEGYAGTTRWGEQLSGEVLFRTLHQVGLTVDAYGEGLVVLHAQPAYARPPHGGGKAIITTYGLSEDARRVARAMGRVAGYELRSRGTARGGLIGVMPRARQTSGWRWSRRTLAGARLVDLWPGPAHLTRSR